MHCKMARINNSGSAGMRLTANCCAARAADFCWSARLSVPASIVAGCCNVSKLFMRFG
jgi:hypothetical protein